MQLGRLIRSGVAHPVTTPAPDPIATEPVEAGEAEVAEPSAAEAAVPGTEPTRVERRPAR